MSLRSAGTDRLPDRNAGIDLVRGISIVLVVIHHTSLRIPLIKTNLSAILPKQFLVGLSSDGYEAVFVFFVVSGFLITTNSIKRSTSLDHLDPRTFYVRRAARILPCLLLLVAVLALLDLAGTSNYAIARADQSLPGAVLAALGFYLNWYEGHTGYLPGGWDVLWSLSIEEVFYLGFPLVCLLSGRYRSFQTLLFATLALSLPVSLSALAHALEIWREKAYLPGMAAISMGVCTALLVSTRSGLKNGRLAMAAGYLGTAALAVLFLWEDAVYRLLGNGTMLMLTGSVALLLAAFQWGWGHRFTAKGTGWLRSFGALSYEIYLTHMFVVFSVVGLFHLSGASLRSGWLWFILVLTVSWCLGRLVDRTLSSSADRWIRARFAVSSRTRTPATA
ncbi:MAG: acyltransferase family protein [Janthinobacterium lividum]